MNIYIGNLAFEVTEGELRQEFTAFGEVITVTIMNDKYIGSANPRDMDLLKCLQRQKVKTQSLPSMGNP